MERINEPQDFHESIKTILNEEIQRYEIVISELTTAINALETEVKECSSIQSLTKSVLLQLTSLQKTVRKIQNSKEFFIGFEKTHIKYKASLFR